MEAYPNKVRELVLSAYAEGTKTKEIARTFKVSRSWARRVKQRLLELFDGLARVAIEQRDACAGAGGISGRGYVEEVANVVAMYCTTGYATGQSFLLTGGLDHK